MVAIVSGIRQGLALGSRAVLGPAGMTGNAAQGLNGQGVYVNVGTGSLVVQNQDDLLVARGHDQAVLRTYNSGGTIADDNGESWRTDQLSLRLTGTLNAVGSTLVRVDRDGSAAVYDYDSSRNLYVTGEGAGAKDTITHIAADGQFEWRDGSTGATQRFEGSGSYRLLSSKDTNGNALTYAYGTSGLLSSVTSASGESTFYDYAGSNLTQVRTVADGVTSTRVRYGYDTLNRLDTVTVDLTPADNSVADDRLYRTTYTYDGTSTRLASITQSDGTSLAISYVDLGGGDFKVSAIRDALNQTTTFAYGDGFATVTDALNLTTRYEFDGLKQLTRIIPPAVSGASAARQFAYAAGGDLLSVTDGEGRVTRFEYDSNGNQILRRDHAGNPVRRTFDARNQLLTETVYLQPDPDAAAQSAGPQTTRYVYDAAGRNLLRFIVSAEGQVTEHRYNAFGERVSSITYAGGAYPAAALAPEASLSEANLASWSGAQNLAATQRVDFAYDARGQLRTRTSHGSVSASGEGVADASRSVEQYVYDQAGLLLQTLSATGGTTTYAYDGLGRLLLRTDALGRTTLTAYDDAGRKTTVTSANGLLTTSAFDAAGRLTAVSESNSAGVVFGQTKYFYDAGNRLRMTQDPTGVRSWIFYDESGRKAADIDGNGTITEHTYNRADQVTRTLTRGNAVDTAALVDAAGLPVLSATLASVRPSDSAGDHGVWREYDAAGRLLRIAEQTGTDARASVSETKYDGASRVVQVVHYASTVPADGTAGSVAPGFVPAPAASAQDRSSRNFHDADGRLAGTLDAEGYLTVFSYTSAGQVAERVAYANATDAALRGTGTLAQLVPASSPADIREVTLYNGKGQVIAQVDGEGFLTESVYDGNGNLAQSIRYATRVSAAVSTSSALTAIRPVPSEADRVITRVHDLLDRLSQETSPEGVVTQYTYDAAGKLAATVKAAGTTEVRTLLARHDVQGRLTGELSAEGAALLTGEQTQAEIDAIWARYGTTHGYDAASRRTSTTDAAGNRTLFFYDADGALTHSVNALGEVQETRYDARGRAVGQIAYATRIDTAGLGGGLVTSALSSALAAVANAALDSETRITYTRDGKAASITDAVGAVTTSAYNAFGDEISRRITGAGVDVLETFSVDRRGQRTGTVTDPAGVSASTITAYDAFGRPTRTVDASGNVREQTYDRLGRAVTTRDPLNAVRMSSYDAFGRILTQTDALGHTTTYLYDRTNRSMTVTTPEGIVTRTSHDRHGQVQTLVDGKGQVTAYSYDANGKLRQTSTSLTTSGSAYDAAGRLTETTDANGNKVVYGYDAANRVLTRRLDPDGLNLVTTYAYDAKGQRVSVTDPRGDVTAFAYDRRGQVLRQTVDPGGLELQATYAYDARGNTLTVTSPAGTVTQYGYDALGRRTQERVDPAGLNLTRSWTYDQTGNVLTATDAAGGVTRYAYDSSGQLVFTVDPEGGVQQTIRDAAGRIVKTVAYVNKVSTAAVGWMPSVAIIAGLLVPDAAHDSVRHSVLDRDGRVTASVDGTGGVVRYTYDANGNVTSRVAYATPIPLGSWTPGTMPTPVSDPARDVRADTTYDALNRAIHVVDGTRAVARTDYDGNGNVIRRTAYATPLAAGVLPQDLPASGSDRVSSFAYDAANRLVFEVDALNAVTEHAYDADGSLVRRTAYAGTIASAPALGSSASSIRASLVSRTGEDRTTRYGHDAAGRQVLTIDATGAATEFAHDAEGRVIARTGYAILLAAESLSDGATLGAMKALLAPSAGNDRITRQAYDAAGRLVYTVDATGAVRRSEYDGAGHVVRTTRYASRPVLGTYTAAAIAAAIATSTADQVEQFGYDAAGRLTSRTDALGRSESYTYDGLGLKTSFTNKSAATWTYEYDAAARLQKETSPGLALSSLAQDMSLTTLPGSVITLHSHDALGNLTSRTEAAGRPEERITVYGYDAAGRQISVTYAETGRYDESSDPLVTEGVAGRVEARVRLQTRTFYDALGDAVANLDVGGALSQKVYDRMGRAVYEIDALGFVTQYGRNAFGEVQVLTRHAGVTSLADRTVHGASGAVKREDVDAALLAADHVKDRTLASSHDRAGRVVQTTERAGFVYDPSAQATYQTGTAGKTTRTEYNAFGEARLVRSLRNAAADAWSDTRREFDLAGRETLVIDALGYRTQREYDTFGNLARVLEYADLAASEGNPDNRVVEYEYDRANQKLLERRVNVEFSTASNGTSSRGNLVTRYGYDAVGNQTSVTDPGGNVTRTYYDVLGRVRAIAAPARTAQTALGALAVSPLTAFLRDAHGNAVAETSFVNGATNLTDAAYGLVAESAEDRRTLRRYDELGRVVQVRDAAGAAQFFSYDAYGNLAKKWQPVTGNDGLVRTTYEANVHDEVGHLLETRKPASTMVVTGGLTAEWTQTTTSRFHINTLALAWSKLVNAAAGTVRVEVTYMTTPHWEEPMVTWEPSTAVTTAREFTAQAAAAGVEITWDDATERVAYIRVFQSIAGQFVAKWQGTMAEAVGDGVVDVAQSAAGQFITSMEYNGFGEMTRRGTQWGRQEYFDYDAAGRLWRTNGGDGVDRIHLHDAQGNVTAEIRSAGSARGDVDIRAIADAQSASTSTFTRRTDTVYDALGRVQVRKEAMRPEYQDGVTVQRVATTATVLESARPVMGESSYPSGWSGQNRVSLAWTDLAPLGSGDIKVQITYRTRGIEFSATTRTYTTGVLTGDQAASGITLSWRESSGIVGTTDAGISAVTVIRVWKKDVSGVWQEVIAQAPGAGPITIDLAAPGNLRAAESLEVRLAGTSNAWQTAGATDFGDRRRYQGTHLLAAGTYEYRMWVTPPGGTASIVATGAFTLTSGTPTQANTQNVGATWLRPVVHQKTDRWGNVTEMSDPRSAAWKTRYRYNANNQLVEQTQPDAAGQQSAASPVTRIYFDYAGRQVAVRDARGNVNGRQFDAAGNLVTELQADKGVVTHRFSVFGEKVGTTDAEGHVQSFKYDKLGRMTELVKGSAQVYKVDAGMKISAPVLQVIRERWTYDEAGRRLTHENGNKEKVSYRNDLLGNLIETTQPLGQKVRTAHDANGRKRAEVDGNGKAATWTYDYFGLLIAHNDLGGAEYSYTYDHARQLVAQTNTRGQLLGYAYDAAGQVVGINDWTNQKFTTYVYDLSGRKLREKTLQEGVTYQDNHLGYDALGRLRDVADARVHMNIEYDAVGNRTRIVTRVNYQGTGGETTSQTDRFFLYDEMNRQTKVDAVDAAGTMGNDSHLLTYDKNGNRISDTHWGDRIGPANFAQAITGYTIDGAADYDTSVTYTNTRYWTKEVYKYDALNRLQSVERDGVQVDLRRYDGADRVLQSGSPGNLPGGYRTLVQQQVDAYKQQPLETRFHRYDLNGRLMHQQVRHIDFTLKASIGWDPAEVPMGRPDLAADGYDAAGNVLGYWVVNWPSGSTTKYTTDFARFDSYQALTTSGVSTTLQPGTTRMTYDVNGFLGLMNDSTMPANDRRFVNDANGRALFVNQGGRLQRQLIVDGEVMGIYGVGLNEIRPKLGDGNPNFANIVDFDFSYQGISPTYPAPSPGAYQVQPGDTLQTIAQGAYGDSALWYRIAEANGLSSSNDMRVGQTLNIPNRVSAIHNNETTFKPYDPSRITGDLTPNLPVPSEDGGCGGVGQLLMAVVAVVVTVYTAGAMATALGGATGVSTAAAGSAALAGGSAAGVTITSTAAMSAGAISATSAVVGVAAGSVASQLVGMAAGVVDKFSWKAVALSAISGGVTAGVGALGVLPGASYGAIAGRLMLANAISQGIAVAVGLQPRFDWRGVAASAVGAAFGKVVGDALGPQVADPAMGIEARPAAFAGLGHAGDVLRGTITGVVAGSAAAIARGGRVVVQQVAVDAFGNALGYSLADAMTSDPTHVTGAGPSGAPALPEGLGQGIRLTQAQAEAWSPKLNVSDDRLGRPPWDLYAGGTPKLSSARTAYGIQDVDGGLVDPETGAITYPVRTPVVETYPLPPMAPLPRPQRTVSEQSFGQYYVGELGKTFQSIYDNLDRMAEESGASSGMRFAAAVVRNPAKWFGDAVIGAGALVTYGLDSQFRSQLNAGVGSFLHNDPIGTTHSALTRYWDGSSGLEITGDTFNLVAGGFIGTPLVKAAGIMLGETASLVGSAGRTTLQWSQRLNEYSFELGSLNNAAMRYQAGALGVSLRNLRAEANALLSEGFEVERISRGGAAVLRFGEDTYYSVPKTHYSLIPVLRTMDTMGDTFTRRVQTIADRFEPSMLSRDQALRLSLTPEGWLRERFMSAYKGSFIHEQFGQELQLIPGGLAYRYSTVGPDVVSRIGGMGLKYEITQQTNSLNAIFSHTRKYSDQMLRYVTYR